MNGWLWGLAAALVGVLLMAERALGYVNGKPVELELAPIGDGQFLRPDAAASWLELKAAAAADGIALTVNYGFRTMSEQQALYAAYRAGTGNLAAQPGYSNHQGGTAVDVNTGGAASAVSHWLATNAVRFGWARTVPSEVWHWEYRP